MAFNHEKLKTELNYKAVKSSGPGGQHVNKTSSKVEVSLNIEKSSQFNRLEKRRIFKKLKNKINQKGELLLSSSATRSQHKNKELVTKKLLQVLRKAIEKPKLRKSTRPTKASNLRRLESKKRRGEKKENRKNPLK